MSAPTRSNSEFEWTQASISRGHDITRSYLLKRSRARNLSRRRPRRALDNARRYGTHVSGRSCPVSTGTWGTCHGEADDMRCGERECTEKDDLWLGIDAWVVVPSKIVKLVRGSSERE
jgi:hypothetical protein